jgi:hypothetical protein
VTTKQNITLFVSFKKNNNEYTKMRVALCLRSISYLENYDKWGLSQAHTIDFRFTAQTFYDCIINDYKEQGHEVDVFVSTYEHPYIHELLEIYRPVSYKFSPFDNPYLGGTPKSILFHLDCIQQVEHYERAHSIQYDVVLFSRFDIWFFMKMSELNLQYQNITVPFYTEDSYFIVPRPKLKVFETVFRELYHSNGLMHSVCDLLTHRGEQVVLLYGNKPVAPDHDYPIYRFARHLTGPHKLYPPEEIPLHPTQCPKL